MMAEKMFLLLFPWIPLSSGAHAKGEEEEGEKNSWSFRAVDEDTIVGADLHSKAGHHKKKEPLADLSQSLIFGEIFSNR